MFSFSPCMAFQCSFVLVSSVTPSQEREGIQPGVGTGTVYFIINLL